MNRKEVMQIINDVSGLSSKEKLEVAREIILDEALSTGLDAIDNVNIELDKVIYHHYK